MNAVNKLLDKAKESCSLASDRALAARIGVSAQQVSQWRKGANPMSDDRVAQVAVIARQPIDLWMVTIRAEQAGGTAAKAWSSLAHKLATSAAAVFMLMLATLPAAPTANASQRNAQAQAEGNQAAPVRHYANIHAQETIQVHDG